MPAYKVTGRYTARCDGQTFGPWVGGETVELSEAEAAWINRDSDGVLTLAGGEVRREAEAEKPREETRRQDRQHKPSQRRNW
jgi:hypothetical protein